MKRRTRRKFKAYTGRTGRQIKGVLKRAIVKALTRRR